MTDNGPQIRLTDAERVELVTEHVRLTVRAFQAALEAGVGPARLLPDVLAVLEEEGVQLPPFAAGMLSRIST